MDRYKVSLIIPCYNGGKHIPKLIDNLKMQTIGFENILKLFLATRILALKRSKYFN